MEELWKLNKINYRIADIADQAEYEKLIQRYREEEEQFNRDHLLYGDDHIEHSTPQT